MPYSCTHIMATEGVKGLTISSVLLMTSESTRVKTRTPAIANGSCVRGCSRCAVRRPNYLIATTLVVLGFVASH